MNIVVNKLSKLMSYITNYRSMCREKNLLNEFYETVKDEDKGKVSLNSLISDFLKNLNNEDKKCLADAFRDAYEDYKESGETEKPVCEAFELLIDKCMGKEMETTKISLNNGELELTYPSDIAEKSLINFITNLDNEERRSFLDNIHEVIDKSEEDGKSRVIII